MTRTKAELIELCTAAAIPLRGDETAAELRTLLKDDDAADGEDDEAPVTVPVFGLHYLIEGSDTPHPLGEPGHGYPRRLSHRDINHEHVSDDPATGVWIYRQM
jgi:hypothetical protein